MSRAALRRFRKGEDGAMTVEWVAIAAAVVVGAVTITWATLDNLDPVASQIGGDTLGTVATQSPGAPPNFRDGQP